MLSTRNSLSISGTESRLLLASISRAHSVNEINKSISRVLPAVCWLSVRRTKPSGELTSRFLAHSVLDIGCFGRGMFLAVEGMPSRGVARETATPSFNTSGRLDIDLTVKLMCTAIGCPSPLGSIQCLPATAGAFAYSRHHG